jgi:hypothetical protein
MEASMRTTILDRIKSQEQVARSQQLAAANVRAITGILKRRQMRSRLRAILPEISTAEFEAFMRLYRANKA